MKEVKSMNNVNKKIIIWGYGFIGKHLAELLQEDNVVYIIKRQGKKGFISNHSKNIIEICEDHIKEIEQADIMYFLAWDGTSGDKRGNVDVQIENIRLACRAIQCAAELHCKKFVYAGSIMEYEAIAYLNRDGSKPNRNYIYSVSKLAADYYAKVLANDLNIDYCNALISNIYGPGERSQRFVVNVCKKLINNEVIELTEGNQLYDFIYISDAVNALKLIGLKGEKNHTYYVGNQQQYPLKAFIVRMKDAIGSKSELVFGALVFNGISLEYNEFDTKALGNIGFENKVTFEEGIIRTVNWLKQEERNENN